MQRKCHACGVTFTVQGDCQTKCELCTAGVSREGRMVYGYVESKEEKPKELPNGFKACEICGKQFMTRRHNQITCSDECSRENQKRLTRECAKRRRERAKAVS